LLAAQDRRIVDLIAGIPRRITAAQRRILDRGGVMAETVRETGAALPRISLLALGLPALASLALHAAADGRYGMFRDEFYYLDCSRHLAWGFVDQPPLSLLILYGWRSLFGESVEAIRVLPALAGALLVILTALMAREMGGKALAQG